MIDSQFKLVNCTLKHAAMLAEIGASTFDETFSPFHPAKDMEAYIEKTYTLAQLKKNLLNPYIQYYAAYNEKGDCGYIKLLDDVQAEGLEGRVMELEKIYVRQWAQGSGVASLLMNKAIELGRKQGYDYLFLGVWQENKRALAFYKKMGFEVFNTRTFQLGDEMCDDFLLKLAL